MAKKGKGGLAWTTNPKSPQYKRFQQGALNPYGPAIANMSKYLSGYTQANDPATQALLRASREDVSQNPAYQALLAAKGRDVNQDPYVQALRAASQRDVNQDPAVQALSTMLSGAPTAEKIGQEFGGAQERLAKYMQGVDYGAGGKAVGDITSMLGTAIGSDLGQTKDIAQTAGTVSGMGGQGGDVYSKAILGGASAAFEGQKAQRMSDVEARKQELGMQRANLLSQLQGQNQAYGLQAEQALSGLMGQQEQYGIQAGQTLSDLMGQRTQYGIQAGQAGTDVRKTRLDLAQNLNQMRAQNRLAYDPFKLQTQLQSLYGGFLTNRAAAQKIKSAGGSTGGFATNPSGGTGAYTGQIF